MNTFYQVVESSNLDTVEYEPATETLYVTFKSGSKYRYTGVSELIYNELINAGSKGSYFHHNIRTSYPYARVE